MTFTDSDVALAQVIRSFQDQRFEAWMNRAKCLGKGNRSFFLERGQSSAPAEEMCSKCPVQKECQQYAVKTQSEYGVWAGEVRSREPVNGRVTPLVPLAADLVQELNDQEVKVLPLSFSATAMQTFVDCPAEYHAQVIDRALQISNSAASLGTVCHLAMEGWVNDGWYKKFPDGDWPTMKVLYDEAYWSVFADSKRYNEGSKLVSNWMRRQDWTNREVISAEVKKSFMVKTSAGEIPFNYVMDRMDRRANGDIEVVDYKTIAMPVQPQDLKQKLQARAYALAAQLEYPAAERIWVTFDLLRHDPIGIVFTKDENRATWLYIHRIAEEILASDGLTERICDSCRWCIRKTICKTLNTHAINGGTAALTDPVVAAEHHLRIENQIAGLKNAANDLEKVVLAHMKENDLLEFETPNVEVAVSVVGRRHIDPTGLAQIIGPALMAKYSDIKVGQVDAMMKAEGFDQETCSRIRQLFTKVYGEPSIKVKTRSPF